VKSVEKLGAKIDNSGISTSHNEAIAARAGAPSGINLRAVATSAKIGAALGATVGLTIAFVESYGRYRRGEATWDDVALATLKGGCIGGTAGAVSCAVGTIVAMASPVGVIAIGTGILSSVAAGLVADWAATKAWDQVAEWLGDERANQSSEVCWLLPSESASFQLLPYRQA
jgi:hypothetical protein